jgi:hypothetical protein
MTYARLTGSNRADDLRRRSNTLGIFSATRSRAAFSRATVRLTSASISLGCANGHGRSRSSGGRSVETDGRAVFASPAVFALAHQHDHDENLNLSP